MSCASLQPPLSREAAPPQTPCILGAAPSRPPALREAAPPEPPAILGAPTLEPRATDRGYGRGLTTKPPCGGCGGGQPKQWPVTSLALGGCDSSRLGSRVPTWLAEAATADTVMSDQDMIMSDPDVIIEVMAEPDI